MRRTKIVCTIGPTSEKETTIRSLIRAGMDMARLNFSHGTHASHQRIIRRIRRAARSAQKQVPIIGDLQGPKIRLGLLPKEGIEFKNGSSIVLKTGIELYRNGWIPVTYASLHRDVKKGDRCFMDDGNIKTKVTSVSGRTIKLLVEEGGIVTSHKGLNFPDTHLSIKSFTKKDEEDARFALREELDWVALSFVTSGKEVLHLRRFMKRAAVSQKHIPRILVKIEKHEAIEQLQAIIEASDAIMVARGDLGIEMPIAEIPVHQKNIIESCRALGRPVVIATQMLNSMTEHSQPTRAEVSDVANAVFDRADAVMLSGETANGNYPVKAVKMMKNIIQEAEASAYDDVFVEHEPTRSFFKD